MSSSLNLLLYMLSTICVQHSVSLRQYHVTTHLKSLLFFTLIVLNVCRHYDFPTFAYEVEISISCVSQANPCRTRLGTFWMISVQYPFVMTPTCFSLSCLFLFLCYCLFFYTQCSLESIFRLILVTGLGKRRSIYGAESSL